MKRLFSFAGDSPRATTPATGKRTLSRRALLRGAGGAALALPFLDIMRTAPTLAQSIPGYTAAGLPKRFVVFFTPNGTIPDAWTPIGSGSSFTFSRILAPLAPFREKLLILDGLDQTGEGGDGHQNGMQGMLTGQTLNPGPFQGGDGGSAGWANGISVDQRIAEVVGTETPLRSLELGVRSGQGENNWTRMSLLGPDEPIPPERDPYKVYDRIFGGFAVSPDVQKLADDRRRVVLDNVATNIRELNAKLGVDDRRKLEQHLAIVEEIEARLGKRPRAALEACEPPIPEDGLDPDSDSNMPAIGKAQMDLLVMAMACDLTRVGSIMWNNSVGDSVMNFVDPSIDRGHHDYSHDGDSNAETIEKLTKINEWYATQFAYFLQRLESIPEGDGTMLDNTIVFWTNELAKGNSHSRNDTHYVIAGGSHSFSLGRCLKFPYEESHRHNDLLLSFIHAMGIEDSSFGRADWCSGPLPGLTA